MPKFDQNLDDLYIRITSVSLTILLLTFSIYFLKRCKYTNIINNDKRINKLFYLYMLLNIVLFNKLPC